MIIASGAQGDWLRRAWACVFAVALGTISFSAQSQALPAPAPAQGATGQVTPAADTARFALRIEAPAEFAGLLQKHLNIQRFQTLADLNATELQRLVTQLPADAQQLMGTRGHFSARATATLEPPTVSGPPLGEVTLVLEPGPQARVGNLLLAVQQTTPQDPAHIAAMESRLRSSWTLASGQAFTQAAWDDAKSAALRAFTQSGHPSASVQGSLADVDSDTHTVNLALEIDPGPAFTFGSAQVEGLQRYEADWVSHMVELSGVLPGSPYDLSKLQSAQQRLAQSGYFESVFVYVDTDGPADRTPVRVKVREALRHEWVLGVGGSTDNGARISAEHHWRQIPWLNWSSHTKVKLERDHRTLEADLRSPVGPDGWHWVAGAKASRQDDNGTITTSQQYRLGKAKNEESLDRTYFVQFDRSLARDPVVAPLAPEARQAVSANFGWARRQFDNMPFPTRGHGLAAEVGVGWTVAQKGAPFLRTRARWQGLWPVPGDRNGRLSARLEGGAVIAKTTTPVPESQLFLTGGDQTVRGYKLRAIGVPQVDGTINPGRLLTVASVEWQRPIWSNGTRTAWESTLFVDVGSVGNQASDLSAKVGVGAGVRYNSAVGPLQMDLAYGVDTRRVRLHLSVGFAF